MRRVSGQDALHSWIHPRGHWRLSRRRHRRRLTGRHRARGHSARTSWSSGWTGHPTLSVHPLIYWSLLWHLLSRHLSLGLWHNAGKGLLVPVVFENCLSEILLNPLDRLRAVISLCSLWKRDAQCLLHRLALLRIRKQITKVVTHLSQCENTLGLLHLILMVVCLLSNPGVEDTSDHIGGLTSTSLRLEARGLRRVRHIWITSHRLHRLHTLSCLELCCKRIIWHWCLPPIYKSAEPLTKVVPDPVVTWPDFHLERYYPNYYNCCHRHRRPGTRGFQIGC